MRAARRLAPAAKADDDGSIWKGDAAECAMTIMAMIGANNFDGFERLKCTGSGDDVMVIFLVRTPPPPVYRHHQIAASGHPNSGITTRATLGNYFYGT